MIVKIKAGVYGHHTKNGDIVTVTQKTADDAPFELEEIKAKRLICLGVAEPVVLEEVEPEDIEFDAEDTNSDDALVDENATDVEKKEALATNTKPKAKKAKNSKEADVGSNEELPPISAADPV